MAEKSGVDVGFFGFLGCLGLTALSVPVGIICLGMWGCPKYDVYKQGMAGEAKLREAESSRMIKTLEAKAALESSKMLAEAEVERAKGVAEANKIIGEGLKDNHEYLVYLWIQSLGDKDNHVIYVPTEAQIPIMEAGRFKSMLKPEAK
jgi:hypothetical protein